MVSEESRDQKRARLRAELAALESEESSASDRAPEEVDLDAEMARELQEIDKAKRIEERVERARVEAEKGRTELAEMGFVSEGATKEPGEKKHERKAKLMPRELLTRAPSPLLSNAAATAPASPPWLPYPGTRNGTCGICCRRSASSRG